MNLRVPPHRSPRSVRLRSGPHRRAEFAPWPGHRLRNIYLAGTTEGGAEFPVTADAHQPVCGDRAYGVFPVVNALQATCPLDSSSGAGAGKDRP